MSGKQIALEVIQKLPDSATIEDVMEELYVRQQIEEGLEDLRAGRVVSDEEMQRRTDKCAYGVSTHSVCERVPE